MDLFDGLVQRWRGDAELEPTKRKLDFPHNCYNDLKRLSNPDMEIISKALDGLLEQYDDMEMVRVEKRLDRLVKVWNDARYIMQQYRESKNSMNVLISRNRTRQHWIAILTIIPCTSKAGIAARPTLLKRSVENEEMDKGPEFNLSSLKRRIGGDMGIKGNPKRQKPNPPSLERSIGDVTQMDRASLKRYKPDMDLPPEIWGNVLQYLHPLDRQAFKLITKTAFRILTSSQTRNSGIWANIFYNNRAAFNALKHGVDLALIGRVHDIGNKHAEKPYLFLVTLPVNADAWQQEAAKILPFLRDEKTWVLYYARDCPQEVALTRCVAQLH
ncbi:hypothetical protein PG988_006613 [Apiospora saccharicola]